MGLEKMEDCPKLSHFSLIFLMFPINFTPFSYISHNVLLAISHNSRFSRFPPISPHSPRFFHFPHFSKPLRLGGKFCWG